MCMKKSVFSELPTIIATFLVLNIPLNLLQNRKRVRQRALRFREFHLHSTKETFHHWWELAGIYAFESGSGEISQDNLQRR